MASLRTSVDTANADGREAVVREALAAARAFPRGDSSYARGLACVAPHLPDTEQYGVLCEAVAAARTIPNRWLRAPALAEIAPNLPEPDRNIVLGELVQEINAEPDKTGHELIWRALLPQLREPERMSVVHDMLAALKKSGRLNRVFVMEILAPYLPAAMLPEAVAIARGSGTYFSHAPILACLVPYLPETSIAELAVEAMTTAGNPAVLAVLAARLPPSLRSHAIELARRPMFEVHARCRIFAALAPHLSERIRCEALAFARDMFGVDAGDVCADIVSAVAPYLPAIVIPDAFAAVKAIPDIPNAARHGGAVGELCRSRAFVALAPYLPEAMLGDALAAYVAVPKFFGRIGTDAWTAFVPRLPGALLQAALAAVEANDDAFPRVMFLAILAQRLPDDERQRVVRGALAATAAIPATQRVKALVALAPHLPAAEPGTELHAAFAAVLADLCLPELVPLSSDERSRAGTLDKVQLKPIHGLSLYLALSTLAPKLPKGLLPAALTAARSADRGHHFVGTLIALVPFLQHAACIPMRHTAQSILRRLCAQAAKRIGLG